jgi:lia operon protein LiaF
MRYSWLVAVILLLGLPWLLYDLLHFDPVRTGLAVLLLSTGYWLVRGRSTVAGVVHLMEREYHLQDIDLACAIADVKIDLSRAIIPDGEHLIRIRGLVGNVDIYVPYDLEYSVTSAVAVGRRTPKGALLTRGYAEAVSRVKIVIALGIGDVNVRCL